MPGRSFLIVLVLFFAVSIPADSQTVSQTVVSKDPTAANLLSRAVSALASGVPINSVTLTATVTRTVGPDAETGTATLEALGGAASHVTLLLTGGQQNETINQSQDAPGCQWSGTDATVHAMAAQNCLIPASWFFPELALAEALNDLSGNLSYIGQEIRDGQAVQHIRFSHLFPSSAGDAMTLNLLEHFATADAYLDGSTFLPVALDFNIHPDNNAGLDIPVEIQYSDYQKLGGVLLPGHVRKLINGSLFLDLNISDTALNTITSPADFAIAAQ